MSLDTLERVTPDSVEPEPQPVLALVADVYEVMPKTPYEDRVLRLQSGGYARLLDRIVALELASLEVQRAKTAKGKDFTLRALFSACEHRDVMQKIVDSFTPMDNEPMIVIDYTAAEKAQAC